MIGFAATSAAISLRATAPRILIQKAKLERTRNIHGRVTLNTRRNVASDKWMAFVLGGVATLILLILAL